MHTYIFEEKRHSYEHVMAIGNEEILKKNRIMGECFLHFVSVVCVDFFLTALFFLPVFFPRSVGDGDSSFAHCVGFVSCFNFGNWFASHSIKIMVMILMINSSVWTRNEKYPA